MQKEQLVSKLLGQSNYATWSFAMQMVLIDNDLWDCVEDSFIPNTETSKKRDAKARAKICLMLSENVYPLVTEAKTAKDTWMSLKRAYADAGLMRRLLLLKKLFGIKLDQFQDIEAYVSEIQAL